MNVIINGTQKQLNSNLTLAQLVSQACKNPKHVITELNGAIIPAQDWDKTALKENDTLELVSFVGGG